MDVGATRGSGVTHLPTGATGTVPRPRELPDAGADGAAAAAGAQLLLPQLHPAQGPHWEPLGKGGEWGSVGDVWGWVCGVRVMWGEGMWGKDCVGWGAVEKGVKGAGKAWSMRQGGVGQRW